MVSENIVILGLIITAAIISIALYIFYQTRTREGLFLLMSGFFILLLIGITMAADPLTNKTGELTLTTYSYSNWSGTPVINTTNSTVTDIEQTQSTPINTALSWVFILSGLLGIIGSARAANELKFS